MHLLDQLYLLTAEQANFCQEYRHIKLKSVLDEAVFAYFNAAFSHRLATINTEKQGHPSSSCQSCRVAPFICGTKMKSGPVIKAPTENTSTRHKVF